MPVYIWYNKTEATMAKKYVFRPMKKEEQQEFEQVLLEQIEIQAWYAIRLIEMWDREVVIPIN